MSDLSELAGAEHVGRTRATLRTLLLAGAAGAAGLGAGVVSACAGASPAGDTGAAGKPPQEITWSIYGDQTTRPFFDAITNRFNEQKAGKYTASLALVAGAEYTDKTLAALAADSASDVFLTYAQYKPAWVKKNLQHVAHHACRLARRTAAPD